MIGPLLLNTVQTEVTKLRISFRVEVTSISLSSFVVIPPSPGSSLHPYTRPEETPLR
jgi:hypothetical protein